MTMPFWYVHGFRNRWCLSMDADYCGPMKTLYHDGHEWREPTDIEWAMASAFNHIDSIVTSALFDFAVLEHETKQALRAVERSH